MLLNEKELNDPIVKSLMEAGFSEETIRGYIDEGDIVLKSESTEEEKEHEKENIVDDEKHIENLKNDVKEDKEDLDKCKKSCKEDTVEKSITKEDLQEFGKSLAESIASAVAESLSGKFSGIEKSLETFGKQTPSFKGADLTGSVLEKSLDSFKDENDKLEVNIRTQRSVARSLIEKAIENADDTLMKSIGEDAKNFLMYPEAETVGENLAMYMYKNMNIKFVK